MSRAGPYGQTFASKYLKEESTNKPSKPRTRRSHSTKKTLTTT